MVVRHPPPKAPAEAEPAPAPAPEAEPTPASKPVAKPTPVAKPAPKPVAKPTPKPAPVKDQPEKPVGGVVQKPAKPVVGGGQPEKPAVEPAKPTPKPQPTTGTEQPQGGEASPSPKPVTDKPQPSPGSAVQVPVTPQKDEPSELVVPLRVPFEPLIGELDALLPKTEEEKDWVRVSKPGDSPEVEITYKVWRERIRAKLVDQTLTITVPLHYAAHFRAKVKNPLNKSDSIWLTKDDTWGSTAEPQDLTVTVTFKPRVQPTWKIASGMRIESLVHGPAPSGSACVKVGLKVCVSRKELAPSIRARIEAYLRPKLEAALEKVDAQLDKTLRLEAHAKQLWSALQKPQRLTARDQAMCPMELGQKCKEPAWLVAEPSAVAMGPLTLDQKDLRVDMGLTTRLRVVSGAEPTVKVRPLPKLSTATGKPQVSLRLDLSVPTEWLSAALVKGMGALRLPVVGKPELLLQGTTVRVERSTQDPERVTLTVQAKGALEGELAVSGDFAYDAARRELTVRNVSYDPATAALVSALAPGEADKLKTLLGDKLRWNLTPAFAALDAAVQRALGGTLPGELTLDGDLNKVMVHELNMAAEGLTVQLSLEGRLDAKYTPR